MARGSSSPPIPVRREIHTGVLPWRKTQVLGRASDICEQGLAATIVGELDIHEVVSVELRLPLAQSVLTLRAAGHRKGVLAGRHLSRSRQQSIDLIAVLPFVNSGQERDMDYLRDGITEGVISTLSQLRQLRVLARSTVSHYRGKDVDPRQVVRELGLRKMLSGGFSWRFGSSRGNIRL